MSLFEPTGPSAQKVRCTVCGRTGWGDLNPVVGITDPLGWQIRCMAGHPWKCTCGRAFSTKQGLVSHVRLSKGDNHLTGVI